MGTLVWLDNGEGFLGEINFKLKVKTVLFPREHAAGRGNSKCKGPGANKSLALYTREGSYVSGT